MDDLNENIKRIKKLMKVESEIDESEISEEGEGDESTGSSTGGVSGGYPTVKKHSDTYQTKRGKANTLDMKTKWESGLARGKANTLDMKTKWESGRTMGSTGP